MCFQCQEEFLGNRVFQLRMHWFTQQLFVAAVYTCIRIKDDRSLALCWIATYGQLLVRMHCIDVKKMESLRSVLLFFTLEWLLVEE